MQDFALCLAKKERWEGYSKTEARIRVKQNIKHQQEGGGGLMQNTTTPQKKYPTIENIALPPPLLPPPCGLSRPIHQRNATLLLRGEGVEGRAASTNGTAFQKHALLRPQTSRRKVRPACRMYYYHRIIRNNSLIQCLTKHTTRQYFPPPLKRCFRPGKPGKCVCVA